MNYERYGDDLYCYGPDANLLYSVKNMRQFATTANGVVVDNGVTYALVGDNAIIQIANILDMIVTDDFVFVVRKHMNRIVGDIYDGILMTKVTTLFLMANIVWLYPLSIFRVFNPEASVDVRGYSRGGVLWGILGGHGVRMDLSFGKVYKTEHINTNLYDALESRRD
jgi:hypothetical protein